MQHNYLNDLNKAQQEAVRYTEGPSLIIAGAGSGKTRVLTYRIAHLLNKGVKAQNILALTFTNKAARDMKDRIISIAGSEDTKYLWMGTFHSKFATILRIESEKLGYSSNYTIYDTADSKNLLKQIIEELKLDQQIYKVPEILGRISSAKNNLITPEAYASEPQYTERDRIARKPETANIYRWYARKCFQADAMDFDDLLLNTNVLFRDHPEVLNKYQSKFNYILVDEYQDTNFSQYLIIRKLAAFHKNVCVVGDDAQSIYSFRGAKIENILNFKTDYPEYKLFKLEQNYRSTQTIVNAANSIIAINKHQIHKKVYSKNAVGSKIKVVNAATDTEEGYIIANMILDASMTNRDHYSNFAILYRINAQSRVFEESCRKRNIPYKIYGGISFYQRKEIKDMIAYFRLVVNNRDEESFRRIVNYPARGIGKTTLMKIEEYSFENDISIWDVITGQSINELGFHAGTINKLNDFTGIIKSFSSQVNDTDAFDLATLIAAYTGILKELHNDKSPESLSKFENIRELLNGIKEFTLLQNELHEKTLNKYLENIALLTDLDTEKEEDRDKVTLMTIHSAKGLEFKYIYIVGVEENLFPSPLSLGSQNEIEEERRLFYVALTRAKEHAVISYAKTRFQWGNLLTCQPSRFIKELDKKYLELPEEDNYYNIDNENIFTFAEERSKYFNKPKNDLYIYARKKPKEVIPHKIPGKLVNIDKLKKKAAKNDEDDKSTNDIKPGSKVIHERFGIGEVMNIEGISPNEKATIFFQDTGQQKQILLKFARLKISE
jgi:DNA helicase-2/ATP-dependent DNA helicase PcrA